MTSSNRKSAKGVTLIELMVVLAVLGIVLGLVYSIFISQMQSSVWRGQIAERKQNIDGALHMMVSDFIKADSVVNTTDICRTNVKVKIGTTEEIAYSLEGTDLIRKHSDTGKAVVARNVTDLKFTCYNKNGVQMSAPAAGSDFSNGEEKDIRRIEITATGKTAKKSPVTGAETETTITTSIELRNIPRYAGKGCGVLYFDISNTSVAFCDPPGDTITIDIWLCNLIGNALGGDVRIFPRGGLPVTISEVSGATVTYDASGTAVMTIPTQPASALCGDPGTKGVARISTDDPTDEGLNPGASLELLAVWQPAGCGYDISTAKSFLVEAGEAYQFAENKVVMTPGVMNACQSDNHSNLKVTVLDSCENKLKGQNVQFKVYDSEPPSPAGSGSGTDVTGNMAWGDIFDVTDIGDGTYTAVYNAGNLAGTVYLVAESPSIAVNNTPNSAIKNTITLNPHGPHHFVGIAPVNNSITIENCINNSGTVEFTVRDECNNVITENQLADLTSSTTDTWAPYKSGGMQGVTRDGSTYSTIYNTSTTHCGNDGTGLEIINVNHAKIDAIRDLTVNLNLTKCTYPGVSLNVEPLSVAAGCPDESVQVTAQILFANATGQCEPFPDPANVTFEVKSVGAGESGVLLQDYGQTGPRNGRFLDELGNIGLATRTKEAVEGTAITNLIAYDTRPGEKLYVRATADIMPYGYADYSKEYANPILVENSPAVGDFYTDSTYTTLATKYTVPDLVPISTENLYAEIRDCEENAVVGAQDTITAELASDNKTGIINTLTVTLNEVDPDSGLSSNNTGVFRAEVPMKRVADIGTLMVDKGGFIFGQYVDDDEFPDISGSVPLTGCRNLRTVDALGGEIVSIVPDIEDLDTSTYADGYPAEFGFSLVMNVPSFAGNNEPETVTVHTCASGDEDTVTLVEDEADNGILRVSHANFTGNYIYVGEGPDAPEPGGDDSAGIRVVNSPALITIVYPENPTSPSVCDTAETSLVNWGCYAELEVTDSDAPTVTLTGIAGTLQGIVSEFLIDVDDGEGTISTVNLKLCNPGDCSGYTKIAYSASPNSSSWASSEDPMAYFDSTEIPNGTYGVFAEAFDTEGNRGESTPYTSTVDNHCEIDASAGNELTISRNDNDTINVSGRFLLNDALSEADAIGIDISDGNLVSQGTFETTATDGTFSWNSMDVFVAPVTARVMGVRNLCETLVATVTESCSVVVTDRSFNLPDGTITVAWEYYLNGDLHLADEFGANARNPAKPSEKETMDPVYDQSSWSWTTTQTFTGDVTVDISGTYGACPDTQTVVIGAPKTVVLTAYDSGWYMSPGDHGSGNLNYIVGELSGLEYRDFFVFDLSGITSGTILDATLSIQNPAGGYSSPDASETWTLYDVSTDISLLLAGGSGLSGIFGDLGGGVSYGSVDVTAATTTATVPLNSSAVDALNLARGGLFAIGGALTTIDKPGSNEYMFGGSSTHTRTLTLTILP